MAAPTNKCLALYRAFGAPAETGCLAFKAPCEIVFSKGTELGDYEETANKGHNQEGVDNGITGRAVILLP